MVTYFRRKLSRLEEVTFDAIAEAIENGPFKALTDKEQLTVKAILESSFDITQGKGYSVKSDYAPWLKGRLSEIDFYYWNRLRDYLLEEQDTSPQRGFEARFPVGRDSGLLRQSE